MRVNSPILVALRMLIARSASVLNEAELAIYYIHLTLPSVMSQEDLTDSSCWLSIKSVESGGSDQAGLICGESQARSEPGAA